MSFNVVNQIFSKKYNGGFFPDEVLLVGLGSGLWLGLGSGTVLGTIFYIFRLIILEAHGPNQMSRFPSYFILYNNPESQ